MIFTEVSARLFPWDYVDKDPDDILDTLEREARVTSFYPVILMHDETVDRTTDGVGPVSGKTLSELRELDAGYRFVDLQGRRSFRGGGARIPTLEEVLEACPHVWVNVEAKERAVARPLVELTFRFLGSGIQIARVYLLSHVHYLTSLGSDWVSDVVLRQPDLDP